MAEEKEQPKAKTAAEKKAEKDKVPKPEIAIAAPDLGNILSIVGHVATGSLDMKAAKQKLRDWVAGLNDEQKEQLKTDSDRVSRTLVAASEALSQELSTLVVSL